MNKVNFDVDIDIGDRDKLLDIIKHRVAAIHRDKVEKHNTGVYFQDMPVNPFNNLAVLDHKEAEDLGFVKIDFLNVHFYEEVKSEEHLTELTKDPEWELLQYEALVKQLFHIHEYGWLLKKLKPTSVEQLAMLLAVIRPSKKHLINEAWDKIEESIWEKPKDGSYYYKKSHAISYAMAVVVHLNLITEKLLKGELALLD